MSYSKPEFKTRYENFIGSMLRKTLSQLLWSLVENHLMSSLIV
jgi:hypothetical protein